MGKSFRLSLKAGERIYINGACVRVDRRVSMELLNEATFLLEHHVMEPAEANTPLRRLYVSIQQALIDPATPSAWDTTVRASAHSTMEQLSAHRQLGGALASVTTLVEQRRYVDALKLIRSLLPIEDAPDAPTS